MYKSQARAGERDLVAPGTVTHAWRLYPYSCAFFLCGSQGPHARAATECAQIVSPALFRTAQRTAITLPAPAFHKHLPRLCWATHALSASPLVPTILGMGSCPWGAVPRGQSRVCLCRLWF